MPHVTLPPAVQSIINQLKHHKPGTPLPHLPPIPGLPNLPTSKLPNGGPAPDQMLDFLLSP